MQLQLWLRLGNVSRAPTKNTAQVSACLHHQSCVYYGKGLYLHISLLLTPQSLLLSFRPLCSAFVQL